ncbi:Sec61 alpha family protein [Giardia muris]|uniref:Sec61 alpha family protein n=1 Tax=Giardia muris TaxID=5742 RepID=A0A4Z1SY33_GIAMU|nr:Sec61 alpha family protein [Giardia muris]|eukprot:TNJ30662.1 Sec61 alpha family protein [Giardia muris]
MVAAWLRVLDPWARLLPRTDKAPKTLQFGQKCLYTFLALVIYLIASQIPLYGIHSSIRKDPLHWLRAVFASQRGSLMELGIGPSITASFFLKILVSAKILPFDRANEAEANAYGRVQTLIGTVVTFLQAALYVVAGIYGPVSQIGIINAIAIVFQLTLASVMVQTLDGMLENGWGVGSGVSLFTTANVCENIVWKSLSFFRINRGRGREFEGAILAAGHYLLTEPNKLTALRLAFFRDGLPNLMNIIATICVFLAAIYLQGVRRNLRIQHVKAGPSVQQQFPIKLLYASSTPMMLLSTITSNVFMVSQALWRRFGNSIFTAALGTWRELESRPGQAVPTGGLAWVLAAPYSFRSALLHPLHTILHSIAIVSFSGLISKVWINFSGEGPKEVADMLESQGWCMPGHSIKGAMQRELNRYIPVAAVTGGVILGCLSLVADIFGAVGSGSGILLAATSLVKIYEEFAKEGVQISM